jgi:molybdopterin synthase sulfur carrier subunit
MNLRVLFFGATAEAAGRRSIDLSIDDGVRAATAFDFVLERFPGLIGHKLLFAVNQQYVSGEALMSEGDELAIFTAVSGG